MQHTDCMANNNEEYFDSGIFIWGDTYAFREWFHVRVARLKPIHVPESESVDMGLNVPCI